ncbi:MAG: 3-keto-5-aminohexanoate cleavage protein [Alphaproteobacteria bacterium]|nr:3-keto-5-aminohexanoate cleavage protein [Alphaproteobacteria bacterium]MBP7759549.1 3-keto-5-aminohexanoate cleavage protein [Alphaproteobacteria bacterium]MBP7762946.1 3-keto-5-aminohexanoate cleavage protein [Alphaproteobacteria bacterium]MBP7904245.1 3-keto-5-aminohexanoate cleavage protein [Alphaproteobacteria bacterium]
MATPCIITVALCGSVPRKEHNPAVPISVEEQIESAHESFEAGATLAHIHARNPDQTPSSDPEFFAKVQEGIKKHCPGMIIQFSTGGRGRAMEERGSMLHHRPDMASLATGSVNFPSIVYANPPDLIDHLAAEMLKYDVKPEIEIFDLHMLYNAGKLVERSLLKPPVHVQFVFGIKNALPAERRILDFYLEELPRVLPGATWTAAGIGKTQIEVNRWCLERGGHCRTGLEDNIRLDAKTLAPSNAALVKQVVDLCAAYNRRPATAQEAREILGLKT